MRWLASACFAQLVESALDELAIAPPLAALNKPVDAAGEVTELNGFFRRYALAA